MFRLFGQYVKAPVGSHHHILILINQNWFFHHWDQTIIITLSHVMLASYYHESTKVFPL